MDNGINKISWRERIGLGSGELAENLIYQTVSIWLLFFYTNVFGLKPEVVTYGEYTTGRPSARTWT